MLNYIRCLVKTRPRPARRYTKLEIESLEERTLLNATVTLNEPLIADAEFGQSFFTSYFKNFSVIDASGDDSPGTVFHGGVMRVNYDFNVSLLNSLNKITIEAWQGGNKVRNLATYTSSKMTNTLVGASSFFWSLQTGNYSIRAQAELGDGSVVNSPWRSIEIVGGSVINGSYKAENFNYADMTGKGVVVHGGGGTDTLRFNFSRSEVASINGMSPTQFDPMAGGQAIYKGTLVDYIRLNNGREIYFTGIERLEFRETFTWSILGRTHTFNVTIPVNLAVTPNDARFADQWNLHTTDVPSAWRFTTGADNVLLVSLDTGILPRFDNNGDLVGQVNDMMQHRLITDSNDVDMYTNSFYGHGHKAITVMAATADNGQLGAGINWVSPVFVENVYFGVNLQTAISNALQYAQENNMRVVFQGGIQGESWLTSGGTQQQLEAMISNAAAYSLFAVAAGNFSNKDSVSGVAALESDHANVMSIGALQRTATTVNGYANASNVNLADYSNAGSNLTIVAPTDVLATDFFSHNSGMVNFGGTSAANPNAAAIASLVWSVNPNLTGAQVRQILTSTAMDLGATGRDDTFGHGLLNADAAVRRAAALAKDSALANFGNLWELLVREIAISPSTLMMAAAPADSDMMADLDEARHFYISDQGLFENAYGRGEKWIKGADPEGTGNPWYQVLPTGEVYKWTGSAATPGILIASLDNNVHHNLDLLIGVFDGLAALSSAEKTALQNFDQAHRLFRGSGGDYYFNALGADEKWLKGEVNRFGNMWYIIMPNGDVREWNGSSNINASPVLGSFDPLIWQRPWVLYQAFDNVAGLPVSEQAEALSLDQQFNFFYDTRLDLYENFLGLNEKWFLGDDVPGGKGFHGLSWYYVLPSGAVHRFVGGPVSQHPLVFKFDSALWDNPDLLVKAYDGFAELTAQQQTTLADLDLQFGLTAHTRTATPYAIGSFGTKDKWLFGNVHQHGNRWYFIRPDGDLIAWNGSGSPTGTLLGHVGIAAYRNPEVLFAASSRQVNLRALQLIETNELSTDFPTLGQMHVQIDVGKELLQLASAPPPGAVAEPLLQDNRLDSAFISAMPQAVSTLVDADSDEDSTPIMRAAAVRVFSSELDQLGELPEAALDRVFAM